MRRTLGWILQIIMLLSMITGCFQQADESRNDQQQNPPENNAQEPPKDMIMKQIKDMTLEEKIGQMVLVGFDGPVMDEHARAMIEQFHVGGFILFRRNIETAEQTLDLLNSLKAANEKSGKFPLFFGIDQEGGAVNRLPEEFKQLPTNQVIGEVNNEQFSYEIGRVIGEELRAFGFNLNFAPVLDINSNPDNPVIGDRSFGASPELVSALGIQNMKGMRSRQVIPVVKHFPGHGDTSTDSHLELPLVSKSLEELGKFELIPFAEAINNGTDVVMIAHILLSQVDNLYPASLSTAVITSLLRNEMGFDGVVITDDLTMGAITNHYDIGDAAVKSVNAGTDIVMIAHDAEHQTKVIHSLIDAVKQGIILEESVDKSVYRIIQLKEQYQFTNELLPDIDVEAINADIQNVLDQFL